MDFLKHHLLSNSLFLKGGLGGYHFDTRISLLGSSRALVQAATQLWDKIKIHDPEIFVGKGAGCAPLISAIKLIAWQQDKKDIAVLMVRDTRKTTNPFKKLIDGPLPKDCRNGATSIFIDDLVNYGNAYDAVVAALDEEEYNINIVALATVIDFWHGSRRLETQGIAIHRLYKRHDLGITRKDSGLPKILSNMAWHVISHHTGLDYMPLKSPPVINNDKIYIGNDNGHQYCYNLDTGDLAWEYKSSSPQLKGTVCEAQIVNGMLYWSSYDGTVRCVDATTGAHIWAAKPDRNLHSSPYIDIKNDRLFLGTEFNKFADGYGEGDIVALQASTGRELWRFKTLNMVPGSPLYIEKYNVVWAPSNDFFIYAIDATTGKCIKKIPTKGEIKGKPAYDVVNDILIVGSNYGYVYGIDAATNAIKWERRIAENTTHGFPYIENSMVYLPTDGGFVVALDIVSGDIIWVTQLRDKLVWGIVDAGQCVIAVTKSGHVVFLDKATGNKLASDIIATTHTDIEIHQPPAYYNGKLVIATNNFGIFCYNIDLDKILGT